MGASGQYIVFGWSRHGVSREGRERTDEGREGGGIVLFSPQTSAIAAGSAAINADGASSTLTVRLFDANGQPFAASGGTVTLTTSLGVLSSVVDAGDGTYAASLTSGAVAALANVGGTLNGEAIADTAGVEFRPRLPSTTTLITVTVRDGFGNLVSIDPARIVLSTTLGALGDLVGQADGTVTLVLRKGTAAGTAFVSGTPDGEAIADTAQVKFRPGGPSVTHTKIEADSALILADGISFTTITVSVAMRLGIWWVRVRVRWCCVRRLGG